MSNKSLSDVQGAVATPLMGETIGHRFERTVVRWGHHAGPLSGLEMARALKQ